MTHSLTSLRRFYNAILDEPFPDEFLGILSGLSDSSAGAGERTAGDLTEPESDIRHADCASRQIHAASGDQSHNLNATLSTHCNRGGCDA